MVSTPDWAGYRRPVRDMLSARSASIPRPAPRRPGRAARSDRRAAGGDLYRHAQGPPGVHECSRVAHHALGREASKASSASRNAVIAGDDVTAARC